MKKTTTTIAIAAFAGLSSAHAALINVNYTGGGTPPAESGLVGPAGGLGTTWNQLNSTSSGALVDSTGAATSATITLTNLGFTAHDTPTIDLTMLRGSFTNFGKGVDSTVVTIGGLANGGSYDIWLVTLRNQPFASGVPQGTEQYVGWWSTTNATTSASNQLVDARGAVINTTSFVDGYNYVLFEDVVANGSGNIVFTGVAGPLLDGSDNFYRLGLNGLQINQVPEPASLALIALGGLLGLRRRR